MKTTNQITRRRFAGGMLKAALLAATAPNFIPLRVLAGENTPSKKIQLGHIGVGGRGTQLLQNFLAVESAVSVAIADPFRQRRESGGKLVQDSQQHSAKLYNDFRDLLADQMVEPDEVTPNLLPPPVKIEEVLVDGEALTLPLSSEQVSPFLYPVATSNVRRMLTIPPGGRQFEFRYTGLSLANPARVAFRYELEGLQEDWFDAGARRSAVFTHLPPGDYTFRVTARNADGVWNEKCASVNGG